MSDVRVQGRRAWASRAEVGSGRIERVTDTLVSIGDFSRMTHLTIKALRYYHEVGVLAPRSIDSDSGYRRYGTEQVPIAQVVKRLRALDMPIDEVREVVTAPDIESRNRAIASHLERMEQQLAQTSTAVASLRGLLETATDAPGEVTFRSRPAQASIAIEGKVQMGSAGPWLLAAMRELEDGAEALGLRVAGPLGALFPQELFETGAGVVVVFLPVGDGMRSRDLPDGRIAWHELAAGESAVMVHRGAHAEMDVTYGTLGSLVAERAIGVSGPIREDFVVSPLHAVRDRDLVTEVAWPVFRTSS